MNLSSSSASNSSIRPASIKAATSPVSNNKTNAPKSTNSTNSKNNQSEDDGTGVARTDFVNASLTTLKKLNADQQAKSAVNGSQQNSGSDAAKQAMLLAALGGQQAKPPSLPQIPQMDFKPGQQNKPKPNQKPNNSFDLSKPDSNNPSRPSPNQPSPSNQDTYAKIKALPDGEKILNHLSGLGFDRNELFQLDAKQFADLYKDYQAAKANPGANDPKKQALVILPEGNPNKPDMAFNVAKEVGDLKKLGYKVFAIQAGNEKELESRIRSVAKDVGGFGLLVTAGHGRDSNGAGIRLGADKKDEKAHINKGDNASNSDLVAMFKDKKIFLEGADHFSLSCNFRGSAQIPQKDSMQAFFQELRPDMKHNGPWGDVPVDGRFSLDGNGKLTHNHAELEAGQALLTASSRGDHLQESPENRLQQLDNINFGDFEDSVENEDLFSLY